MIPNDNAENRSDEEINLVLDYLLDHRMQFTKDFLRNRDLPFSGTKAKLRERLTAYLSAGKVDYGELVSLLNAIEGWGNQHVYFYHGNNHLLSFWQNLDTARNYLISIDPELVNILNRPIPLVLPDETTLSSIEWTPTRLRLVWIERREWNERVEEEDIRKGDMLWQAYRVKTSRGLVAFDWHFLTNDAMLMIHTLPSGSHYRRIRATFEDKLNVLVHLDQFDPLRVAECVHRIKRSDEVRRRHLEFRTVHSGTVKLTSSDTSHDTLEDPVLERTHGALESETAGLVGHLYWKRGDGLSEEVNCKIYGADDQDQRVSITGEHREQDVRYVLSRIRYYCN